MSLINIPNNESLNNGRQVLPRDERTRIHTRIVAPIKEVESRLVPSKVANPSHSSPSDSEAYASPQFLECESVSCRFFTPGHKRNTSEATTYKTMLSTRTPVVPSYGNSIDQD
ncbi:hypothetical protein N8642_00115 [bacterium]|nr:hypothetical protein [Verrucomicrobiota bacterium]MDA7644747.1 hypothetical protein [bacterium]